MEPSISAPVGLLWEVLEQRTLESSIILSSIMAFPPIGNLLITSSVYDAKTDSLPRLLEAQSTKVTKGEWHEPGHGLHIRSFPSWESAGNCTLTKRDYR